ncbi:hypothetical protein C0992_001721 [Termitomyces sp. T32_za158]|nr:hypothetical protein C0992_001721 [Termitomyces sp. T32_za158]
MAHQQSADPSNDNQKSGNSIADAKPTAVHNKGNRAGLEPDMHCAQHDKDGLTDDDANGELESESQPVQSSPTLVDSGNADDDSDEYLPSEDDEDQTIDNVNLSAKAMEYMSKFDPSSRAGAMLLKNIREELQKAFLGYSLVYATSDNHFGAAPCIRRNVINPRIPDSKTLDLFYRATHHGATLDPLNVQHAVTIGVHPSSLDEPLAKDPTQATIIKYRARLCGLVYEDEKLTGSRFANHIPILLDGGHRFDLIQKRVYRENLIQLNHAILQLKACSLGGSSPNSDNAQLWKARYDAALTMAKDGVWLARVYNMKFISQSKFRPQLLLLLCANTPVHRISDSETTHIIMISDILNNPQMDPSQALNYYLKYQLNPTDSMNARIRGALSNQRVTFALSNLMRIAFFRTHPAISWNINQMYKWQRVALSIVTPHIEWMVLLFNVLASTHNLALTDTYPQDESLITEDWKVRINTRLELFDLLPFTLRDVYLDVFNDQFFHIILNTWSEHLHDVVYWYGTNFDQESDDVSIRYQQAWKKYETQLLQSLFTWIRDRSVEIEGDGDLERVLTLMPDRIRWIVKAQVVSGFRLPQCNTKTGILAPLHLSPLMNALTNIEESLLIVLGQFDSMAAYELRTDRRHSSDNLTYLDLVEAVNQRTLQSEPTTLEIRAAACGFIGLLIARRRSAFYSMRVLNGGSNTKPEAPPPYIAAITKGKSKDPRIESAIDAISTIIKIYSASGYNKVSQEQWEALRGGPDCIPTSRKLLVRAISNTASPWLQSKYTRTGNSNRSNYFGAMAAWLFLTTHAVTSSSVEFDYKEIGYEEPYWNDASAYQLLCDLSNVRHDKSNSSQPNFHGWHRLIKHVSTTTSSTEPAMQLSSMAVHHGNVASASAFLNDIYRFLQRSQIFSLDVSSAEGSTQHVLVGRARNFMDTVTEFVKDGLVDFHKDQLLSTSDQTDVMPDKVSAICNGLIIPPYKDLYNPTADEEKQYYSAQNLDQLNIQSEMKHDIGAHKKVQKLLAVKGVKRERDESHDTLTTKAKKARKPRAKKIDPNAPGSSSAPIDVDKTIDYKEVQRNKSPKKQAAQSTALAAQQHIDQTATMADVLKEAPMVENTNARAAISTAISTSNTAQSTAMDAQQDLKKTADALKEASISTFPAAQSTATVAPVVEKTSAMVAISATIAAQLTATAAHENLDQITDVSKEAPMEEESNAAAAGGLNLHIAAQSTATAAHEDLDQITDVSKEAPMEKESNAVAAALIAIAAQSMATAAQQDLDQTANASKEAPITEKTSVVAPIATSVAAQSTIAAVTHNSEKAPVGYIKNQRGHSAKRPHEEDSCAIDQSRQKSPRILRSSTKAATRIMPQDKEKNSINPAPEILVPSTSDIEVFSSSPLDDAIMDYGEMSD